MPACRDAQNGALRSMKCRAAKTRFHGTTTTRGTGMEQQQQQQEERRREFARCLHFERRCGENQRKFAKGLHHEPWTRKPASPPRSDARAESQTSAAVAQTQTMKRRRRPQSGARASRPRAESLFPPRRWVSGRRLKAASEPQRTALCYLLLFP